MTSSRAQRRAAVELLVCCLRERESLTRRGLCAQAGTVSPRSLIDAAAYHAVSGLIWQELKGCAGVAQSVLDALRARYDAAVQRHMQVTWELRRLSAILDASGAPWAVVKGPALVELAYGDAGLRSYADIDVIVEPSAFDRVLAALAEENLRPLDRNWRVIHRSMRGELHFVLPSGIPLDLHWHVVNMYRGQMRIDAAEMLERRQRASLGGVDVPTLDATDAMIHLALHGTLSGADKLLWMSDIARSAVARPPDWPELVRRAAEWKVAAPVGFMLLRAATTLDAPIPLEVAYALLGRRWQVLGSAVDRVAPWQDARGRVTHPSLLLTRSMGLGMPGAARWLVARTIRHFDPREPHRSSSFSPSGGSRDFDSFVRAVVTSGAARKRD